VNQTRARIEVLAVRRGWSLTYVAERMGITLQGLGSIMERDSPADETIAKIAAAFEVSEEDVRQPVTAAEYGEAMLPRA
jgi:transcriptional regulator with XRE-family HTH domain